MQGLVSTPTRRGPTFVCAHRRGLCSMSGCYPYGIDNPPTLRRSSFPRRALRPAGGPMPKHAWGCAPRPPNAQAAAGYERCESIVRTAPQIRSQGACGAFYFGFNRNQINMRLRHLISVVLSRSGNAQRFRAGCTDAWGSRGPPQVTFGYFSSQKSNPSPGRRASCHPPVTPRRL